MSKTIEIKYTLDSMYKELKGFHLYYEYQTGMLDVFNYIPEEAIIILPVMVDGEIWNSQRVKKVISNYVTTDKSDGYTFEEISIKATPPADGSTIKDRKDVPMKTVSNSQEEKIVIVSETPITVETQNKEESIMTTFTKEQTDLMIKEAIEKAMSNVTASPVKEAVVDISTEVLSELTKEFNLTEEDIQDGVKAIRESKVEEILEFVAKNGSDASKEIIQNRINNQDNESFINDLKSALVGIKLRSNDPGIKAKASELLNGAWNKTWDLINWMKKQGLNLIGFVWASISWVWSHLYDFGVATLGFVADILGILFNHTGQIVSEVGQSAQNRYMPVFDKWANK